MSVYIDDGYEIECRFSWSNQPEKPSDCGKCFENDWCPLSLYDEDELANEHRKKRKETV